MCFLEPRHAECIVKWFAVPCGVVAIVSIDGLFLVGNLFADTMGVLVVFVLAVLFTMAIFNGDAQHRR